MQSKETSLCPGAPPAAPPGHWANARKRPRSHGGGGALGNVRSLDDYRPTGADAAASGAPGSPLLAYASHIAFLTDIRNGVVPAELMRAMADGRDVPVSISVEDFLPHCFQTYVEAYPRLPPPPAAAAQPCRQHAAELSPASLRSKRLQRFQAA